MNKIKKNASYPFDWGPRTMYKQEAYQQINKLSVVVGNWYKHNDVECFDDYFVLFCFRKKSLWARRINSLIYIFCKRKKKNSTKQMISNSLNYTEGWSSIARGNCGKFQGQTLWKDVILMGVILLYFIALCKFVQCEYLLYPKISHIPPMWNCNVIAFFTVNDIFNSDDSLSKWIYTILCDIFFFR